MSERASTAARDEGSHLVNIRVVNLGQEPDFGGGHWVVLGQKKLELEQPSIERRVFWAEYHHMEVALVVFVRARADAGSRIRH